MTKTLSTLPRVAGAVALAAALALPLVATAPAAAQSFGGSAEVVVIEVPVQVTRDGEPVRGLTADDFEVSIGRREVPIVDFDVVDLSEIETAIDPAVSAPARRHFLLLFDLGFSEPQAVVEARAAARELVVSSLHPSDLVAVATFTLSRGPQLVLGFTSDRRQIETAISTLGAPELFDRSPDPLGVILAEADSGSFAAGLTGPGGRFGTGGTTSGPENRPERGFDAQREVLEYLEELAGVTERSNRAQQAAQVQAMSQAMEDLGALLGEVDGRKHVVLLSEGFDGSLLVGEQLDAQQNIERNLQVETGEAWRTDSRQVTGNTQLQNDFEAMLESFRRANAAIHTIDIGGARAGADVRGRASGAEGLTAMARSTGGNYYANFNQVADAMGRMLEATSVTYVLAIQPQELEHDGEYHRLRVRLKERQRGTDVAHRPGFFAPSPQRSSSALGTRLSVADLLLAGEVGGPLDARALAAAFPVAGEPAYVPVLIEIDGRSLLAGFEGEVLPAEIYAYAMAADGAFVDHFHQNLGLEVDKVRPALEARGLKFYGHLDLVPGDYSIRVLVRNAATGAYAVDAVALAVPAATSEPTLLPPLFPEAPGSWLMVREGPSQQQERAVDYPFTTPEGPFIPAALPRVEPEASARLYLRGYNLGEGEVRLAAEVIDAGGRRLDGGQLAVLERTLLPDGQGEQLVADFRPLDLPAGRYRLRVTVTDPATGESRSSSAPFEVVGG